MRDMSCVRKLFIKALEGMVAQTDQECYRGRLLGLGSQELEHQGGKL